MSVPTGKGRLNGRKEEVKRLLCDAVVIMLSCFYTLHLKMWKELR